MHRKILCGIIISLQIVCVIMMAWFMALESVSGGWQGFGAIPFLLFYGLLLIVGIVLMIWFAIERQWSYCITIIMSFIVTGVFVFPDLGFRETLVHGLEPMASFQKEQERHKSISDYNSKKEHDYNVLKEYFSQPRKVIKVKNALLLLEDQKIVAIRGIRYPINNPEAQRFLNENVVGHYVKIDIGTFDHFTGFYIPGGLNNFEMDLRGTPMQEQFAIPYYACIPAEVYIDGVSLGDKFSLQWASPVIMR